MRDRGMMKWNSFNAITQHGNRIEKMLNERKKITRPTLSIDQVEEMNRLLQIAIEDKVEVYIQYYNNGCIKNHSGIILRVDIYKKEIIFTDKKIIGLMDLLNINIK